MTNHRLKILIISAVFYVSNTTALANEKEIKIATTEFPPFYSKSLKNDGYVSEVIRAAFERKGYKIQIDFLPWKRALVMAKDGRYDGIFTLWYRKEREKWFVYSTPLATDVIGFFKLKKKKITFDKLTDLKPYSIGTVRGYANPEAFVKADLKCEESIDDLQNIKRLIYRRIDLILIGRIMGRYLIKKDFPTYLDKIEWMGVSLTEDKQYLGISKKSKGYQKKVTDFNDGYRLLLQDGTIKNLQQKHDLQQPSLLKGNM